jgi:hypothetical protein
MGCPIWQQCGPASQAGDLSPEHLWLKEYCGAAHQEQCLFQSRGIKHRIRSARPSPLVFGSSVDRDQPVVALYKQPPLARHESC